MPWFLWLNTSKISLTLQCRSSYFRMSVQNRFFSGEKWSSEFQENKWSPETQWAVRPIGRINAAPYPRKFGVPKQATIGNKASPCQEATIQIYPEYIGGLLGLKEFDYIWVISMLHLNSGHRLTITPKPNVTAANICIVDTNDGQDIPAAVSVGTGSFLPAAAFNPTGLFSSRAPHRPNPIGISALRVTDVNLQLGIIYVLGIDLLDGTPVLDIKPYVPAFDSFPDAAAGWMDAIMPKEQARITGYQTIVSKRGARAERARLRVIDKQQRTGTFNAAIYTPVVDGVC